MPVSTEPQAWVPTHSRVFLHLEWTANTKKMASKDYGFASGQQHGETEPGTQTDTATCTRSGLHPPCRVSRDGRAAPPPSQRPWLPTPETQGSRSSNMGCCMLLCSLRLPLLLHRVPPRSSVQLHQSSPGQVPRGTVVGQPLLLSQHPSSNLSAAGASQTMHTKGTGVILKFLICRVD